MPGLSLLKDRPDIIALPDDQYPPWLWDLLTDPAIKTTHASVEHSGTLVPSGGASAAAAGAAGVDQVGSKGTSSRGEARIKQKQEMRERRQAFAAAQAAKKKAASGSVVESELASPDEIAAQQAKEAVLSEEEEGKRKKELRRANREAIKARNFLGH